MLARRVCLNTTLSRFAIAGLAMLLGCAHDARPTAPRQASTWIDRPLTRPPVDEELAALEALKTAGTQGRIVRLDRLVDLLDAARFGGDGDARDVLWEALGGHSTGRGPEATRTAFLILLQEGLALAEAPDLSSSQRDAVADLIMLLSADLGRPATADDLAAQLLAYRTLARRGHPRVADNALWRLYDHVRGILAGAVEAPTPLRRMEIATHALYANQDDLSPWLADRPSHARPPWPTPTALGDLLVRQRSAVAEIPRWSEVADIRRAPDETLRATVQATLPAPRDPRWPLPTVPAGTGTPESLAPVILATPDAITVDAGRPQARTLSGKGEPGQLPKALQTALAVDGRGRALLVAPPLLPSPTVERILTATFQAHLDRLELAVHEPGVEPLRDQPVVTALPLEIVGPSSTEPRARAFEAARVRVHLQGSGARFELDGQWLPNETKSTPELPLETLKRAFPRETVLVLTTGGDVLYQQLVEFVVQALGGERSWMALALSPATERPGDGSDAAVDRLERRIALAAEWPEPRIDQPFPLQATDQAELEALGQSLTDCLPELELPRPLTVSVPVTVVFEEGAVIEVSGPSSWPRGADEARRIETLRCFEELAFRHRLGRHRDRIEVVIHLGPASSAGSPKNSRR